MSGQTEEELIHYVKMYNHRTQPIVGDLVQVAVDNGLTKFLDFLLEEGETLGQKHMKHSIRSSFSTLGQRMRMLGHLVDLGLDVNEYIDLKPYLSDAVVNGRITLARNLLKLGADVNLKDSLGDTPLVNAALHCPLDKIVSAMKLLLRNGADERIPSHHGQLVMNILHQDIRYDLQHPVTDKMEKQVKSCWALMENVDCWRNRKNFSLVSRTFCEARKNMLEARKSNIARKRKKSRSKPAKPTIGYNRMQATNFLEYNQDILSIVVSFV